MAIKLADVVFLKNSYFSSFGEKNSPGMICLTFLKKSFLLRINQTEISYGVLIFCANPMSGKTLFRDL